MKLTCIQDVADMLYQHLERGDFGPDQMLEWVRKSELPDDVKWEFERQCVTGVLYPEVFDSCLPD